MKAQLISFFVAVLFFTTATAQSNYTINGNVTGLKEPSKIFLQYRNGDIRVNDSATIQNGKFTFKGQVDRPVKATLVIHPLHNEEPMTYEKQMALDRQEFYLEKEL